MFDNALYMLTVTLLAKFVGKRGRGLAFTIIGVVGSLGILLQDELGGHLFDTVSHKAPFWVYFGACCLLSVIFVGF